MKSISNYFIFCIAILAVLISLNSCKKDKSGPAADVYLAGNYIPPGKMNTAVYWLNGKMVALETGAVESHANDIRLFNGVVYVAGDYDGKPCVWIGGVRIMVYSPHNGSVTSLAYTDAVENKIFIAGYYQPQGDLKQYAFYLQNFDPVFIDATGGSKAQELIFADNSNILSGIKNGQAGYWENGVRVNLGNSPEIGGLAKHNNVVYLSGSKITNGISEVGYWEGNVFKSFGNASSVAIYDLKFHSSGKMYLSGIEQNQNLTYVATLWEGEQKVALSTKASVALDLAFDSNNIYVAGVENKVACYWVNKKLVSMGTAESWASSIYVE